MDKDKFGYANGQGITIIKRANVLKHGAHDQKTHGRKGGGIPKEFTERGGSVSKPLGEKNDELAIAKETLKLMEDMLGNEFKEDDGVKFTKRALIANDDAERKVMIATTEEGLAGAISYTVMDKKKIDSVYSAFPFDGSERPEPHIYIDMLGSTGIIDKTGSALANSVFQEAADKGLGVLLESASDGSSAFWKRMGLKDIELSGFPAMAVSASEVKELVNT